MKYLKKNQHKIFKNSSECTAYEYPIEDTDINISVITINGRYPEKGRSVNKKCKEVVYIISGTGYAEIEDNRVDFSKGDIIFIDSGEKFFWFGEKLKTVMCCTPAFDPKQHINVD